MIKELSFSALSAYASDRQRFIRQYIKREEMPFVPQFLVGHGVHFVLETYLKSIVGGEVFDLDATLQTFYSTKEEEFARLDEETTTQLKEEIFIASESGFAYLVEHLEGNPLHVEVRDRMFLSNEGALSQIPYAGTADLITDGGVLYDWKSVARFSGGVPMKYILQGHSYAQLAEHVAGIPIKKILFIELKKTHPKTRKKKGEPHDMVNVIEIPMDLTYRRGLNKMYEIMAEELLGAHPLSTGRVVPNIFGLYDVEEGWDYFIREHNLISSSIDLL